MLAGPLVIIGNGMAGARLAEHLVARRTSHAFAIVMFGDEPGGSYNRILLSGVLAGKHAGPDIVTNPLEWYAENGVRLRAGTRAERIDIAAREVVGEGGVREAFDSLVFATGSSPIVPAIHGLTAPDGSLMPGHSSSAPLTTARAWRRLLPRRGTPWSSEAGCSGSRRRAGC